MVAGLRELVLDDPLALAGAGAGVASAVAPAASISFCDMASKRSSVVVDDSSRLGPSGRLFAPAHDGIVAERAGRVKPPTVIGVSGVSVT